MRPKGERGPISHFKGQVGPKPQVDPPVPILAPNLISPKNGHKDPRTQIGHFQPLASLNHQRPPAQAQEAFPSIQWKDSPSPIYSIPGIQEWCVCGIIYHYAPILLSNPMVMVSGPNYAIPNQIPKSITHCEASLFSHSVLKSLEATRRLFKDHNHLARQELGCTFFQDYSKGSFKRLLVIQSFVNASSTSVFPWTTQLVHTGGIQASCMALALLGQFIFHCWNSITQFNSQDGQICINPKQSIKPGINTSGSVFNFSHILATFSSLGTFSTVT
ncbi:hypothetical protein O181_104011 [Austropuccinia psidii MF-1]|uniref:Uncharacterized protein n=1 Tax=Austropuccinia psidii MF-1 TaxID=1389203 RepID=A0A9Q3JLS8_9BASI|nr:hypothetical protein [Austropuccinia psidii MF-1]